MGMRNWLDTRASAARLPAQTRDGGIEPANSRGLRLWVTFPDCWDGETLSTEAASSHVVDSVGGLCPSSHPVPIPQLQMAIDFPAVDPEGLSLASGDIETAHADFWNVWDQQVLENEVRLCLNRDLVCGISRTAVPPDRPTGRSDRC